jgi:hypothetical protein
MPAPLIMADYRFTHLLAANLDRALSPSSTAEAHEQAQAIFNNKD